MQRCFVSHPRPHSLHPAIDVSGSPPGGLGGRCAPAGPRGGPGRCAIRPFASGCRAAALAVAIVGSFSTAGCGEGPADGLDRKSVSGKVTLDGQPLAKGAIAFDPADGSPGATPAGGVIVDGYYSIDSVSGPTPGKYRVSIRSAAEGAVLSPGMAPGAPPKAKKGAADAIPPKYNLNSELTAQIDASGSNTADFALTSK